MILLFIISSCQNPISETGYSTTDLNHPEFSYAGAKGTTGSVRNPMSVSPTSFNNNGFIPTCTIVPALPPGLSIHPSNCVISGTPVNVLSKTTYTITAQNIAGLTRESVVLNVVPSKPTISYTLGVGLVNQAFTHTPTLYHNDSPITGCAITPALPEGFSLHPTTCVITGESSAFISSQTHSVTVTNGIGSTTTNMTFLIAGPPILSYSGVSTSGSVANAMSITPSAFEFQGAGLTSCTTSPALPNGLEINNETCVISGTPTVTDSRSYTITATNPAGSSTESLSLNIVPSPPAISFSGVLGLGFVAIPFLASPSLLDDNRALITSCQSTTTLPTGLSIHPNTCVISGIPSGMSSSNPYTIRATNSAGYTDASFLISISPSAPTISYSGVSGSAVYNSSFTIAPGILNLNGASISSCTISPALPSGLSIHNSTCAISGSPSELSPLTTYTVTVQNSAGSSTGTLSLSVTGGTLSFNEDGVAQTIPIHLPGGVAGASCSPLSFSGNSLVTTTISGIHPDCLASIQPNSNQNGSGTLTLSFNNISSPSTTLGFSIASVDDAPVSSALSQTINEDVTTLVTLNYSDVEGHLATTCALSNLTNLTGTCSCNSGVCQASIRGTSNYFGSGSFTYTVNANGVNSNSSLASITINSVDDAPVASSVSGTLIEDTQGTVNLSYTDVESHEATTCTLSSLSNLTGTCACTSGVCTATVTGTSNFNGSAGFSYTVTANGVVSNSASATITISLVNDAPVLANIAYQTTDEDVATTVTLSVVEVDEVINCSSFLNVTSSNTTLLPNASIAKSGTAPGCVLTLTPALNKSGVTTVTVVASDGILSDTKSFVLTVNAVNDAPVLAAISAQSTTENIAKSVTLSVSDVDNAITCSSFISATSSNTTLIPNANIVSGGSAPGCTLTLTPVTAQTGSAIITVTASDGLLPSVQTFTLTVNPNIVTITQYATYRGWSNQTFARTCHEYRYPTAHYQYSGATGDSTATASTFYRIDPDGAGPIEPLNVSCDMTNGGWTSLSALSTATTGFTTHGTLRSGDLVISNSAVYTAVGNLSKAQILNYSITFTETPLTGSRCSTDSGTENGNYFGEHQCGSECCREFYYFNEYNERVVIDWYYIPPISYQYYVCSKSLRFTNLSNEVIYTFTSEAGSTTGSTNVMVNLGVNGPVRKIETQTSCSSSGTSISGGAQFTSATVKFGGSRSVVRPEILNTLRANFVDCGQTQQALNDKIDHCSQVNFGATVDVGGGKLWKLVTRTGISEFWMDNTTGLVWSSDQALDYGTATTHCSTLSNYGITNKSWYIPNNSEIETARNNGYPSVTSDYGYIRSSTHTSYNSTWVLLWSGGGHPYTAYFYAHKVRCVFSSRD